MERQRPSDRRVSRSPVGLLTDYDRVLTSRLDGRVLDGQDVSLTRGGGAPKGLTLRHVQPQVAGRHRRKGQRQHRASRAGLSILVRGLR